MITIGTVVIIIYPDYAKGLEGIVIGQEEDERWLIRLDHLQETILLSVNESVVIRR